MREPDLSEPNGLPLNQISTKWSAVHDRGHFLIRYAESVRNYLRVLLRDDQAADDVAQEFFLSVVAHGFVRASSDRGRFRDYLKVSVRHAALSFLRKRRRQPDPLSAEMLQFVSDESASTGDSEWLSFWRQCLLERGWRGLERHEHAAPECLYHTVLRLTVDHADEDSAKLAERISRQTGRPVRADAYRKQLSRARRMFAELLVREVAVTLEEASPELVEDELRETGLLHYILPFLAADWRERGQLLDAE